MMQNGRDAPPSLEDAARALDAVDACLLGLLPATTTAPQGGGAVGATWPTPEQGSCVGLVCFDRGGPSVAASTPGFLFFFGATPHHHHLLLALID